MRTLTRARVRPVLFRCHPSASESAGRWAEPIRTLTLTRARARTRIRYAGPWVEHPTQFSNDYAIDMLGDEWRLVDHDDTWLDAIGAAELRPAPGNRQVCPLRTEPCSPMVAAHGAASLLLTDTLTHPLAPPSHPHPSPLTNPRAERSTSTSGRAVPTMPTR